MKRKEKKVQPQAWRKMALSWGKYISSPAHPCQSQLKNWKEIIKKEIKIKSGSRALILGSTPELRDLALDLGFKVTVVDINSVMTFAMTSLMKNKDLSREKRMIGNWLRMKFPKNYFDLILGDATFCQILKLKDLESLMVKLRNFLKPKGIILIRELVRLRKAPIVEREKDWIFWLNKYKNGFIDKMDLHFFLKYQSDANNFKTSPDLIDGKPVFYKLKTLYLKGKVPKDFYDWYGKTFGNPPVSKLLLIFLENDLEKLLRKYFKLTILKFCSEHYHCRYMPQYLLRVKR